MNNLQFDFTSDSQGFLRDFLASVFRHHIFVTSKMDYVAARESTPGRRGSDGRWLWNQHPRATRLVFYLYAPAQDCQKLAAPLTAETAHEFISLWLASVPYGEEPDTDGHNTKGYRVYNEAYGHVDNDYGACMAISPEWITYGK